MDRRRRRRRASMHRANFWTISALPARDAPASARPPAAACIVADIVRAVLRSRASLACSLATTPRQSLAWLITMAADDGLRVVVRVAARRGVLAGVS